MLTPTSRRVAQKLFILASTLLMTACAASPLPSFGSDIVIWDSTAKKIISNEQLIARSLSVDFVLIGETHDNPVHHRFQNSLLIAMSAMGRRPVLVMEQFDLELQSSIDRAMLAKTDRVDSLKILRQEMAKGWDWSQYQPLIETAKDRVLPLKVANLSRARLQQVSRNGFAALGNGAAARLALDNGWSIAQQKQLEQDVVDAHCGVLPAQAATPIANAQRARDAVMADTLLQVRTGPVGATTVATAVAIFGRGHVRRDLAVPFYLTARAPHRTAVVIGLIDSIGGQMPDEKAFDDMAGRYDYLVLTPAVKRKTNPCDGLVMSPLPATN